MTAAAETTAQLLKRLKVEAAVVAGQWPDWRIADEYDTTEAYVARVREHLDPS